MVGGDADSLDNANAELPRNDRRRNKPTARNADDRGPAPIYAGQSPGERACVTVKLIPGNGESFFG